MYDMQSGLNVNTAQKNRHPVKGDGLGFVMINQAAERHAQAC